MVGSGGVVIEQVSRRRSRCSKCAAVPTTGRLRRGSNYDADCATVAEVAGLGDPATREFVVRASYLDNPVSLGTLTGQAAIFLEAAVTSGPNILVAGGTQAGNTALRQYTQSGHQAGPERCPAGLLSWR